MLVLLSLCAMASAIPASLFSSPSAGVQAGVQAGRANAESTVAKMLKDSGITTLENVLEGDMARSGCLAAAMCRHGAVGTGRSGALNTAFGSFNDFLQSVWEQKTEGSNTKHIESLIGAMEVGQAMGVSGCSNLYHCDQAPSGRLSLPVDSAPCEFAGPYCPGLAMGCSMCGIFSPATCAAICPVAAVSCGTLGYICDGPPAAAPVMPSMPPKNPPKSP